MIHRKSRQEQAGQSGFSLLETLLALAIMSMTSLALFQSTASLLRFSERTVNAAFAAEDEAVTQKSFAKLIEGIVPDWPDRKEHQFRGTANGFVGMTSSALHTLDIGLHDFSLSLQRNAQSSTLIYNSQKTQWKLKEIASEDARFSYLGADNVWRSSWPPKGTPEAGNLGDARFFKPPALPLAIRLQAGDINANTAMVWIVSMPLRAKLDVPNAL